MKENIPNITMEQYKEMIRFLGPSMDDYLYVYDFKKDIYMITSTAQERFLLPGNEFRGISEEWEKFVYPEDLKALMEELADLSKGERTTHNLHYRWLGKEREPIWINCRGNVLKNEEGEPQFLVGCINEIGTRQKADNVSGLLGESSLRSYVKQLQEVEYPKGFALRIGIDDFKDINENYGIDYGDFILRKTAECIAKNLTIGQKLYRIVADEFMLLDFEGGSLDYALSLYQDICKSMEEFVEENHYETVYTVSGGILDIEILDCSYGNVMKLTEFSLNEAKRKGKNQCYIFQQKDYDAYLRRKELIRVMRRAVYHECKGFEVYFQPIVHAKTHQLNGAEALLRFKDSPTDFVSPAEFIPILEETGLIIPVGRWVLDQALSVCKEWQKTIPGFRINVNLSYVQIMKSQVFHEIIEEIKKYGLKSSDVTIELTESGYLETNSHFTRLWGELQDYGVQLALDDFGTGYSNLRYLYDLSPSIVKIDHSFTAKALSNEYQYNLMIHIIEMSHSLGLKVCIEGIETEEELERISRLDPDYIQGYLFGKPCRKKTFCSAFVAATGEKVLKLAK